MKQERYGSELAERALRTLRACETSHGCVAGRRHFNQIWIRDATFAAWGHLSLSEYEKVEALIALISSHVDEHGRLPLRFGDPFMLIPALSDTLSGFTRFDAREPELNARWGDDKRSTTIVDSNPLFVVTAGLLELSRGSKPTKQRFAAMERAFAYSETLCRYGLIWQEPYADWCDSVKRRGYVTYTNALHYAAARVLSLFASTKNERDAYAKRAEEIRTLMNERLWTTSGFAEWTDETGPLRVYSVESNMLCALFGISDARRTKLLFSRFDRSEEFFTYVGRRASPRYPKRVVSTGMRLIGMGEYHDRMQWLWTTGLALLASRLISPNVAREDRLVRAVEALTRGDTWISEVYLENRLFRNVWYKSEEPFAWSSGMLLAGLIEERALSHAFSRIRSVR